VKSLKDTLQDADPLRREPHVLEREHDRLRQAVISAARDVGAAPPPRRFRAPVAVLAVVAVIVTGVAGGFQIWSHGAATLQAAVRFEMRLAEDHPGAGLREVRAAGSDRAVYLHDEVIVTNADIARSRIVPGDGPSHFNIAVEFNAAGAQKMQQATADHVGRPVAVLIDGEIVMAPILRAAISTSALITGDYSRAEAERIVNGIGVR
jgi:hypothetical protein